MSDDLVNRWSCDQDNRGASNCRNPYGCHCREITANATALEEARAVIERLRANVTRLTANPADHRYWEGRWRDADRELSTLRARVREVVGPFAEIRQALELISANKPGDELLDERAIFQTWGLKDTPTSKQITLGHLRAARQLMEEVK